MFLFSIIAYVYIILFLPASCKDIYYRFCGYFIIDKLTRNVMEGWTSLAVLILIVSGIMMLMMGILGEYMWRNLDETRKRPLYVIEEVIDKNENTSK